ncbi:hypothetical protein Ciccas_001683 [Cichlidogyrus casuarinus]|uniref:G-protein coupled receptors family 1 profile domain-containing protein n=1 Tax=Cichlidogyrus casuarinus TaxID=1844966 RepID=A0ABD2QLM0_9PLAT
MKIREVAMDKYTACHLSMGLLGAILLFNVHYFWMAELTVVGDCKVMQRTKYHQWYLYLVTTVNCYMPYVLMMVGCGKLAMIEVRLGNFSRKSSLVIAVLVSFVLLHLLPDVIQQYLLNIMSHSKKSFTSRLSLNIMIGFKMLGNMIHPFVWMLLIAVLAPELRSHLVRSLRSTWKKIRLCCALRYTCQRNMPSSDENDKTKSLGLCSCYIVCSGLGSN